MWTTVTFHLRMYGLRAPVAVQDASLTTGPREVPRNGAVVVALRSRSRSAGDRPTPGVGAAAGLSLPMPREPSAVTLRWIDGCMREGVGAARNGTFSGLCSTRCRRSRTHAGVFPGG